MVGHWQQQFVVCWDLDIVRDRIILCIFVGGVSEIGIPLILATTIEDEKKIFPVFIAYAECVYALCTTKSLLRYRSVAQAGDIG